MNMKFDASKTPVEGILKRQLEELMLEIFILVLMVNETEDHQKKLMS